MEGRGGMRVKERRTRSRDSGRRRGRVPKDRTIDTDAKRSLVALRRQSLTFGIIVIIVRFQYYHVGTVLGPVNILATVFRPGNGPCLTHFPL